MSATIPWTLALRQEVNAYPLSQTPQTFAKLWKARSCPLGFPGWRSKQVKWNRNMMQPASTWERTEIQVDIPFPKHCSFHQTNTLGPCSEHRGRWEELQAHLILLHLALLPFTGAVSLTHWRQDPPSAKILGLALLWSPPHCSISGCLPVLKY